MNKLNLGKVWVEVVEVKRLNNNTINKGEVVATVQRTLWSMDGQLFIKYKGHTLKVSRYKGGEALYYTRVS